MVGLRSLSLAGPTVRDRPFPVPLRYPAAYAAGSTSPVPLPPLFRLPREALPLWRNGPAVTQREFTLVFPSFLRERTMRTQRTPDNKSPEATRLERVRLDIMPLLELGDVPRSLPWRQVPGLQPS